MNSLGAPWMLLLLLLIPAVVWLRYHPCRQPRLRFSDASALRQLPRSWAVRLWPLLPAAYALGWACLVFALAQPRFGTRERSVRTEAVDIILLVDVSSSMRAEDLAEGNRRMNRLESAQAVIEQFIDRRPADRIGLLAFAAMPYSVSPLTLDHDWLKENVKRLRTDMLEDGTAIGSALASAVDRLRDSEAISKLVILLTDGENNAGSITPLNAAQLAKAMGVKVYTVGAGKDGMVPVPVANPFGGVSYRSQYSRIDEPTLREIARATEARYFRATDLDSLEAIYGEIDDLEKTEIDVDHFTQFDPRFAVFVAAGLLMLLAERGLALTRLGRQPQ
jgi:Ca-activated chloride channel family protein